MSQTTFGTANMTLTNTPRSFANTGTPTTSDNKSNGNSLSSTYSVKRGGWGSNSIWGNGSLSSGFSSRDATRENSRSRDTRSSSSNEEVIEGKTGSSSLVDSSVSDDWNYKSPWGAKRSLPSARSISHAQYPDPSTFQPRSASNAGLPTLLGNTTQTTSFGSRPPPVSLNPTALAPTRTTPNSGYPFGFGGRSSEQAPAVYTKFNRPTEPSTRELPDSAKDGVWSDYSPTDERKPFNMTFGGQAASTPVSRDGSIPSSFRGDEQPLLNRPNYPRTSQRPTQNNSRAPSISSQGQISNANINTDADRLAWQLDQLGIKTQDRPMTSHKGSFGSSAIFNQLSPGSATSQFSRSAMSGVTYVGDNGYGGSPFEFNLQNGQGYESPQQASAHFEFSPSGFGARTPQTPLTAEFGQRQPFVNGTLPAQLVELPPGPKSNVSWTGLPINGPAMERGFSDPQEQSAFADFRIHQQMLGHLRTGYPTVYNPYGLHPALPINGANSYVPMVSMNVSPVNANGEVGDMVPRHGEHMQSMLMMDFKANNAKAKHFQLKDIYEHIAEFSGDQHGSRFIQTKLKSANSDEKERVFLEIEPNAIQLMTDVFGNYVIQKFFEHGDQRHKKILAFKMKGEVLNLSLQMYGCRVVQKALDHVFVEQQHELVQELEGQVLKCVKDQNGNHVIQKAIERCQPRTVGFIIQAFRGEVQGLSIHPYGCRVIQRCLERCEPGSKAMIMDELMGCIDQLISDQYGNYVVQHVVQHDEGQGKELVLNIVGRGLETYSKHKFASNVVEKCLEKSSDEWRRQVVWALANGHPQRSEGDGVFISMIKDSYGNYVIQKLLDTLCVEDYLQFVELLQPALSQAKRTGCGKQVLSIEKKMHRFPPFRGGPQNGSAYNTHTYRMPNPQFTRQPIDSAATTPPPTLKSDKGSLQSSAIQSVDGDAVEGAHAICSRKVREPSPGSYFH